jgi:hypothetical protein
VKTKTLLIDYFPLLTRLAELEELICSKTSRVRQHRAIAQPEVVGSVPVHVSQEPCRTVDHFRHHIQGQGQAVSLGSNLVKERKFYTNGEGRRIFAPCLPFTYSIVHVMKTV